MQGRHNRLTCRECGKSKSGNYFISETLCKKCAAKRRRPKPRKPNPIVELDDGLKVTSNVATRLKGQSESEIPWTWREWLADLLLMVSYVVFWAIGWHYSVWSSVGDFLEQYRPGSALFILFVYLFFPVLWYGLLPVLVVLPVVNLLWKERGRRIETRTSELARERQKRIDEAQQFYASAEWQILRKEIVEENKNVCQSCGKTIKKKFDITVDHVLPRSKFPQLSLEKSNLRILCRSCNSSKGDYVPPEVDRESDLDHEGV